MSALNLAPFATEYIDGALFGPWRAPTNIAADAEGTIHADSTAQALGLKGGTVAGSIHMEQFTPLALAAFGPEWTARGGLSLYFRSPTRDGEAVRAALGACVDGVAPAWMISEAGARVCEGEAWLGAEPPATALRQRLAALPAAQDLRILAGARLGQTATATGRIDQNRLARDLPGVTERLSLYAAPTHALPCNLAVDVLRAPEPALVRLPDGVVGLYGAIELHMLAGPLRAEVDYRVEAQIAAVSETPKTEVLWYESRAFDAAGAPVASMLMMSRIMKASSPRWR